MSKSLKALEMIERELYLVLPKNIRDSLIQTIKQDLERKEQLEKENQELKSKGKELKQDVEDVLKDYKNAALRMFKYAEIIETLKDILNLNVVKDKHNNYFLDGDIITEITKEQYNILKEIKKKLVSKNNDNST